MDKPIANQSSSEILQAPELERPTAARAVTKVALLVEHDAYEVDHRIPQELLRFLSPQHTELSLIHLFKNVTEGLPIRPVDASEISQAIIARTERQIAAQQEFNILMQHFGFSIADEQTFALQTQNLQEIMAYIRQSGLNLAVCCADYSATALSIPHHSFIQLVIHLPVSALLIKRPLFRERQKLKVLLGVDDSEASMTAARKLGMLLQPESLEVILATVQSPVYQENAVLAPFVNQQVLEEALESNARLLFEMVGDILETQGIPVCSARRMIGSPANELGYLAQLEEPDLVVVGSHNRTGVLAWVMGSVSSQLLQWDTHNILIVR
jgi:nucleotide-binding universal stress UspA family protein